MSQTSYDRNFDEAYAGMKADSGFDRVESFQARTAVPFGRGVSAETGDVNEVQIPVYDRSQIVWDGDFVTSNKITVTVNGESTGEVDFDTDHATTVEAVRAAIEALSTVDTATRTDTGGDDRTIMIEKKGTSLNSGVTETVTGGAGQASGTITYNNDDIFRGISVHTHEMPVSSSAQYEATEAVNVMRQGTVWVETSKAVDADSDAYVDISEENGKFTDASSGNMTTSGKFRSSVASAGLAKLEVNLP